MSDDPSKRGLDRKLISTMEEHEVRNWTKWLGVNRAELLAAVKAASTQQELIASTSAIQGGNAFASTG